MAGGLSLGVVICRWVGGRKASSVKSSSDGLRSISYGAGSLTRRRVDRTQDIRLAMSITV